MLPEIRSQQLAKKKKGAYLRANPKPIRRNRNRASGAPLSSGFGEGKIAVCAVVRSLLI
jgi:hypothetical protein